MLVSNWAKTRGYFCYLQDYTFHNQFLSQALQQFQLSDEIFQKELWINQVW